MRSIPHQDRAKQYSDFDREIISLAAVWDLIDSMVNYANFEKEHRTVEATLMFKSRECSLLFIILLADFLALPRPGAFGFKPQRGEGSREKTYLGHLVKISQSPHLNSGTSLLLSATEAFSDWLDGMITVSDVWLPSIERNGPITVKRLTYLNICGTASKHGFARLGEIVGKLRKLLQENGTSIDEGQSYLALPDFQEWFRDHVFMASSSSIAFFLNEIRWGIFT